MLSNLRCGRSEVEAALDALKAKRDELFATSSSASSSTSSTSTTRAPLGNAANSFGMATTSSKGKAKPPTRKGVIM